MHPAAELVPNRRRTFSDPDPLWAAMQPPENETVAERTARLRAEYEAKRVSDGIDAMLLNERTDRRRRREIKVLLLGQSESGKSTTLKRESSRVLLLPLSYPPLSPPCFFSVGVPRKRP